MISILRFLFSGIVLKILIVLAGIYALYFFNIWPFKKNVSDIGFLKDKYCKSEKLNQPICDCIVKKLEYDLIKRFTSTELEELKNNRLKNAYAIKKSLAKIELRSKGCLDETGNLDAWNQFQLELATLDNGILEQAGNLIKTGYEKVKEKMTEKERSLDAIDQKYK